MEEETPGTPPPGICKTCPCWRPLVDDKRDLGECRRMPPSRFVEGHYQGGVTLSSPRWEWPVLHEEDYCFEHPLNSEAITPQTYQVSSDYDPMIHIPMAPFIPAGD